jgi:hypothetical protein
MVERVGHVVLPYRKYSLAWHVGYMGFTLDESSRIDRLWTSLTQPLEVTRNLAGSSICRSIIEADMPHT